MDRFGAMSVLVASAEGGSLSAAARRLDVPLTTVSRKIADLERHLGTQLLTRSSRSVILTDAGRCYVEACKRILDDVGEAEQTAKGEYAQPKGELRVTAPIVLGRQHLLPVLAAFLRAHPDIDVRLTLADRVVNLIEEGVDVALRLGELPDSSMVATRVGLAARVFAASPAYLRTRATPQTVDDLLEHERIGVQGFTNAGFWGFAVGSGQQPRFRLIVNSTDAACEAATEDAGVISVFAHHVASHFQRGSLVPVLPDLDRPPLPINLVWVSSSFQPLKLRAFLDFATPLLKKRLLRAREEFLEVMKGAVRG